MTLRFYCEQMGLVLRYRRANSDWACEIVDCIVESERIPASAHAVSKQESRIALVKLIAGQILQEVVRPTTRYWVPENLMP
jgi:hypothetical protein